MKKTLVQTLLTTRQGQLILAAGLILLGVGLYYVFHKGNTWVNGGGWTTYKEITIDPTKDKISYGGSLPVLIRLSPANFQFDSAQQDASDIRFIDADNKTELPYQIEKYDIDLQQAFVWVQVKNVIKDMPTKFYLYYANAKAPAGANNNETYDIDTVLVYHFNDGNKPPHDSTKYHNSIPDTDPVKVKPSKTSFCGEGLNLDGQYQINIPASPTLTIDKPNWTWTGWIKVAPGTPGAPATGTPNSVIFSQTDGANSLVIGVDGLIPFVSVNGQKSPAGQAMSVEGFQHLAVVAQDNSVKLFLNGELYSTLVATLPQFHGSFCIGGNPSSSETGFVGELDEMTISRVARPDDYIKLLFKTQSAGQDSTLLVLGADKATNGSDAGGSSFGVIFKSLTWDGECVIGILILMALGSWYVMVVKTIYINKVFDGNKLFMKEWMALSSDLTALDEPNSSIRQLLGKKLTYEEQKLLKDSPLYKIYHIGSEEVKHHLALDAQRKSLSAPSIESIRASLDGGTVRETQQLNSLIVLLTIAISGGPFIGLLGTVVGVMITFSTIAQAGTVSINEIAPGMSAALMATVAGLGVAIPALFGYNYLLSKIKDATSDMHVFIDEFVTKMAVFYR